MTGELDLYGVYVPALFAWAAVAAVLTQALRGVLRRLGFYRWVWHGALFDIAAFILLLGGVIAVAAAWTPQ